MNQKLRILHLEDEPDFSIWLRDYLVADGLDVEVQHVVTKSGFENALAAGAFDLVISDFHLHQSNFTGIDALKMVRDQSPLMPFILMSGTIGEMAAIESLKAGATDYVLKQGRERLPSAVRRAMSEAAERTQREALQENLKRSERQYRVLFQGNPHPMWVFDFEKLTILEVNEAAIQHYGYSRDEFLQMTISDLRVPGKDFQGKSSPMRDVQTQGLVWRHRHKSGRVMEMEVVWSPLVFRSHLAALTMATDVTARRLLARHNLIFGKLTSHLSAVISALDAAHFICEAADELFHWDDFALDLYSAEKDEVVSLLTMTTIEGKRVAIPASPQPKSSNALVYRVLQRGPELLSASGKDGASGATLIAPIHSGERIIGVLFIQSHQADIYSQDDLKTLQTLADHCGGALQRVQAEENLRHSQQRFKELFNNSPDAIFVEDFFGNVLDVNPSACALHGLTREELVGKNAIESLVPEHMRDRARAEFPKLTTGEVSWIESESMRRDGSSVPVEIRVTRLDFDGRAALMFNVRDVSERRAAVLAAQKSEMLFRSVWENSVDGMRLTDENGTIVAVNDAFCRLVGMEHSQLEDKPLTVVYSTSHDWERMLREHRERFRAREAGFKRERDLVLHDNRAVAFEITDSFVEAGGKPRLVLSLFRDITAHKRLEEQFRQSQKMEAVGQLAGGIAHDFNNILTIILGHATLLTLSGLDQKSLNSARQVKQAAERAASLTRQLLAFGRKSMFSPRPMDLSRVIDRLSEMLTRLLGEDIVLDIRLPSRTAVIEADSSMMEQIILNLSVNSRDAMPRGGQLFIRVNHCELTQEQTRGSMDARPGKFVCLSHSDTGAGIPKENLQRIFEPFFTTKELGKGTGLGLATVFGIVKQHQGWIEVESEVGRGTTFRVYLPASTEMPVDAVQFDTQFRARNGIETILVVEDERVLREIITRTLNRHGYRIFQAVDGPGALQIWSQYKDDIDLLFTDIVMPGGMNGRELGEKLLAEKPGLKILYSSGYGAETLGKDFKLDPDINFLQKPYLPQKLALAIRRCLDVEKGPLPGGHGMID